MTRAQYVALCIIGGVAIMAYIQSYQVAKALRRGGIIKPSGSVAI